jgi:Cutinase
VSGSSATSPSADFSASIF